MTDNKKGGLGFVGRIVANVRFVLNYGKEDRNDPNFSWLVARLFLSLRLRIDALHILRWSDRCNPDSIAVMPSI